MKKENRFEREEREREREREIKRKLFFDLKEDKTGEEGGGVGVEMKEEKAKGSLVEYLVCGGLAGGVARTLVAPIERVKIIFQINTSGTIGNYRSLVPSLIRQQGVLSLWRGNSAALLRVVPYMAVQFLAYEKARQLFSRSPLLLSNPHLLSLLAGASAGASAALLTSPLDLARARLAAADSSSSPLQLLQTHRRSHGALSLYRGVGATLCGVVPYAGLKFWSYEAVKAAVAAHLGVAQSDLPVPARMFCGAMSALTAIAGLYPLDVVRRRFQTAPPDARPYRSTAHALLTIWKNEGFQSGLYRGFTLNLAKVCSHRFYLLFFLSFFHSFSVSLFLFYFFD